MITMPLPIILQKLQEESKLSAEELKAKIKTKMDELSGLISEEGAAHIIANELGVKLQNPDQQLTIDKVQPGMRGIEIVGKARQVYEVREFKSETRSGKVGNFLLTDTTGTTRIVLWNDQADLLADINVGDVIKIKGAYARSNNDRVELHLGHDAKLLVNPEGVTVDVDVTQITKPEATTKKLADISAEDQNVTVIATVVQVFDPRFFPACPECNSRAKEEAGTYTCANHGEITPKYNYVMNLYLDDSTDNIRCVLWREQINDLLGKTEEEMTSLKDDPAAFEQYKTDLLGMIIKVRGRINNNEAFGRLELVAYEITKNVEPEAEEAPATSESHTKKVAEPAKVVTEEETVTAKMDDDKVNEVTTKKETSVGQEDEELFTLDDIEDLEDLD